MSDQNLPKNILVIDDDYSVGQSLESSLAHYNVKVTNCQDLNDGLFRFEQDVYEVVFVRTDFGALNGFGLIQRLRQHHDVNKRATAYIVMTSKEKTAFEVATAKELCDIELINKPFSLVQVLPFLSRGMDSYLRSVQAETLRSELRSSYEASGNIQALIDSVKALPTNVRIESLVADVCEEQKLISEALMYFEQRSLQYPKEPYLRQFYAHFLMLKGEYVKALEVAENLNKQSPYVLQRMQDLGWIYIETGNNEKAAKAIEDFFKFAGAFPDDVHFSVLDHLIDKGLVDVAVKICKKSKEPLEVIRYYNNRGIKLVKEEKYLDAISGYRKSLVLCPKHKENYRLYYNIALAHIKMKTPKDYKAALDNLKLSLELKPDFDRAKETLEILEKKVNSVKAA